jgi:hypothetical protein
MEKEKKLLLKNLWKHLKFLILQYNKLACNVMNGKDPEENCIACSIQGL